MRAYLGRVPQGLQRRAAGPVDILPNHWDGYDLITLALWVANVRDGSRYNKVSLCS